MGAKKQLVNTAKSAKSLSKAKTTAKIGSPKAAANAATKARSTPVKAIDKSGGAVQTTKSDELKSAVPQKSNITSKPAILPKASPSTKKSSNPATPRSQSPKKPPLRGKLPEKKSKALTKVIKSLDIKFSGFKTAAAPAEEKIECKASISEIVKTKSRAASAKISPGPLGKPIKKDDEEVKRTKTVNSTPIVGDKSQCEETKDSKSVVLDEPKDDKKAKVKAAGSSEKDKPEVPKEPVKQQAKTMDSKAQEDKVQSKSTNEDGKTKECEKETKAKVAKKTPNAKVEKKPAAAGNKKLDATTAKKPKKIEQSSPVEKTTGASTERTEPVKKKAVTKKQPKKCEKQQNPEEKSSIESQDPPKATSKGKAEPSAKVSGSPAKKVQSDTPNKEDPSKVDVNSASYSSGAPPAPEADMPSKLSVRERLQKKYAPDNLGTFKAYKAKKQVDSSTKVSPKSQKPEDLRATSPSKKPPMNAHQENDVYDFKTESESEDNIKMNLLVESSILTKLGIAKTSDKAKKKEEPVEPVPTNDTNLKPAAKKTAKKGKDPDKDFSEEDDQPLQQTKKLLLEDSKQSKQSDSEIEKKPKIKEDAKSEAKKPPAKTIKASAKPKQSTKKPANPVKRKARAESSNSNSDDSIDDDSDDTSSSSSAETLIAFGPKRHRMASLNALAKVQCLYENESRTAHELGLSKSAKAPKIRIIASGTSSDEEENAAKKLKKAEPKEESVKEENEDSASEIETKRELRNAPGLRGMGKHWDFNEASSFESGHESDPTFRQDEKTKSKKRKVVKTKSAAKAKEKSTTEASKSKKTAATKPAPKKKPRPPSSKESSDTSDDDADTNADANDNDEKNQRDGNKKRKRNDDTSDVKFTAVTSKRMASLNASAIVAATYEVERHLDRNLDSDCSSFESLMDDVKAESSKKIKELSKPDSVEDSTKESSRPTSSSVVIVQDTDVTITGVYVNSSTGSSQEAYCKMQYRVQSSVTEERVLRPSSIDPPKSYTPLSALSSMRPPGTDTGSGATAITAEDLSLQSPQQQQQHQQQTFQPTVINREQPPTMQQTSPAHIHGQQQYHHYTSPAQPSGQEQMHHMHHQQSSPQKYHHMHHHHPHQQPPIAQPRCESPMHYPPGAYHPNVQPPMPPPPNSISISGGPSSAFCAPIQQSHHDMSGYYQPAGPLISPHVLPTVPPTNSSLVVSTKQISSPIDSDRDQLQQLQQQQHQSAQSTGDSQDNDVLITGGDLSTFRYPSQHLQQQQHSQQPSQQSQSLSALSTVQQQQVPPPPPQNSPYARPLHPMHYTTAYPTSYYSPYPGDAMCYSPPYQPYFPAKVYQSAPAYRRYSSYYQPGPPPPPPNELYEGHPTSVASTNAQPPPPQVASQLVPTGPGGPQHIEHYPGPPGYYPNYNPGGGQCYSRSMQPPYMEYSAPCPCPMQTCPKNVLTGPLIGSNNSGNSNNSSSNSSNNNNSSSNTMNNITANNTTSNNSSNITTTKNNSSLNNLNQQLKSNKGPVIIHNHLIGQHEQSLPPPPASNLPNGQSIHPPPPSSHRHHHHLQCKMELIEPLKAEIKSGVITDKMNSPESRKTGQYEETVVPPTPPSIYTVNDKLTEPDETVSPARGSAGLPILPENAQEAATQVLPVGGSQSTPMEVDGPNITSSVGRKARIGKSMAREMMYGAHTANLQVFNGHHRHQSQHQHLPSHNSIVVPELSKTVNSSADVIDVTVTTVKSEIDQIKKEPIKVEDDDDVVILEQEVNDVKSEPEVVDVSDKSSDVEEITDTNGLATDDSPLPAKRIKILDTKASCKKSSTNGYKSLIRQTEPKSYLCLSTKRESRKSHLHKNSKLRTRIRRRKVVLTDEQKERLSIHKRNLIKLGKKQPLHGELRGGGSRTQRRPGAIQSRAVRKVTTFQNRPIDLTGSGAGDTRGYFSEPEIRSSGSRKAGKGRTQETRSRSETKKSQINKVTTNGRRGYEAATAKSAQMPKLPEKFTKPITSSQECRIESATAASRKYPTTTTTTSKNGKKKKSTGNQAAVAATWQVSTSGAISDDCNAMQPAIDRDPMIARTSTESTSMVLMDGDSDDEDDVDEPNNNDMANEIAAISSNCRGNFCGGKRPRARGHRFSSKKRAKNRRYQTEVDNSIIPRKSNAVPKWNNGWSWCGEPFQAKVFLNSDDPLVIRTCYPAMRHVEGDLIRPRDCVLLRAGSKKNELPYVAKVAHLWENPEDGEMMMSLLWYYRPEHTEQGRQDGDCPDEVFASRHRDHNSVACIEDKCYVLTFSEYCRYRRRVRAVEEGIENINRTVPALKIANYSPKVPVITNPEQVMFCQRVYEFRLKRLLKTPTN